MLLQKPMPGTGIVWRLGEARYIMVFSLGLGRPLIGLFTRRAAKSLGQT
jgi:hypothetical protein